MSEECCWWSSWKGVQQLTQHCTVKVLNACGIPLHGNVLTSHKRCSLLAGQCSFPYGCCNPTSYRALQMDGNQTPALQSRSGTKRLSPLSSSEAIPFGSEVFHRWRRKICGKEAVCSAGHQFLRDRHWKAGTALRQVPQQERGLCWKIVLKWHLYLLFCFVWTEFWSNKDSPCKLTFWPSLVYHIHTVFLCICIYQHDMKALITSETRNR